MAKKEKGRSTSEGSGGGGGGGGGRGRRNRRRPYRSMRRIGSLSAKKGVEAATARVNERRQCHIFIIRERERGLGDRRRGVRMESRRSHNVPYPLR